MKLTAEDKKNKESVIMANKVTYTVYTDGSYNEGIWGAGAVVLTEGQVVKEISTGGVDEFGSRNIAGEIQAVVIALRYIYKQCVANNTDAPEVTVNIYHDYIGLSAWAKGEWKAKKQDSIFYQRTVGAAMKYMNIVFHKVEAHSGVTFNERADELAKAGVKAYTSCPQPSEQQKEEKPQASDESVAETLEKAGLVIPKNTSTEALNLAEQVLDMVKAGLMERAIKMSTLKPLDDKTEHTFLRAVGTNEIERVIENIRYQLKCEAEA